MITSAWKPRMQVSLETTDEDHASENWFVADNRPKMDVVVLCFMVFDLL